MFTITDPLPENMNTQDLLAHVEARYQAVHRRLLPELVELARKVEHVHNDIAGVPPGLADALDRLALALDMHMEVEETVLFPAMRGEATGAVTHPIALMRSEHEAYAAELDSIDVLAHGFVPPEWACGSWRELYQGVAEFSASLRAQISLEDRVLFPRFDLPAQARCTCTPA